MPENFASSPQEVILSWEVDQSDRNRRGRAWYAGMILAGAALLIYAVASANFLFALLVLMFALVIYLTALRAPNRVIVEVTGDGITVGGVKFAYRDISRFWFVYEPPEVKMLYLGLKSSVRPHLPVPLDQQNPNEIRNVLGKYLTEDLTEDSEPISDIIGRILKF
ncbi:MAG: hypothetical protein ABIJ46_05305 [bacterium]